MNSFKKQLLIYFLSPVLITIIIGNYISITKLQEDSIIKTELVFKNSSLLFKETITNIDREARNVSRRILFNYLLQKHSDSLNFKVIEQELSNTNFFNSASLLVLPKDGSNESTTMYFVEKGDDSYDNQIIKSDEFSESLMRYINNIKETKSIAWSSKYKTKDTDKYPLFSLFTPIFEEMKLTGIIVCNIDNNALRSFVNQLQSKNTHGIYAYTNTYEPLISSELNEDGSMNLSGFCTLEDVKAIVENENNYKDGSFVQTTIVDEESNIDYLVYASYVQEPPMWLIFKEPRWEIRQSAMQEIYPMLIIDLILLVILIIVLFTFSNRLSKPIKEMQVAIAKFVDTYQKSEIKINRNDELGLLAKDFNFMQDELIAKDKELKALENAKSAFLKMISHEIRTPLNGILGSASILKESIDNEDINDFIEMLNESAERLDSLSRKALVITELKTRNNLPMDKDIDLSEFILNQLKENDSLIASNRVKVLSEIKTKYGKINKDMIWQAIHEILINTNQFAHDESPVTIKIEESKDQIFVSFINKGPKIPEEKLSNLGKPFELGQEHYDKYTGLGLALVSLIMELHDGKFEISNTADGVSTTLFF